MVWFSGSFEVKFQAPPSRTDTALELRRGLQCWLFFMLSIIFAVTYLVFGEGSSEFRKLRSGRVASSVIIFVVAWLYGLIFGKLRGEIAALGLPGGTASPVSHDGVDEESGTLCYLIIFFGAA